MRIPLPLRTPAETPSPRMFWVSIAIPLHLVMIHPTVSKSLTIPARTDRIIRVPTLLARASDHRHSQAESGFCTDRHSCVNIQRHKRYRVHVRVSGARNETFLPYPVINSLETPTGTEMRKRSGPTVWRGTWDSAVSGVSYLRERSRTASEEYLGPGSPYCL